MTVGIEAHRAVVRDWERVATPGQADLSAFTIDVEDWYQSCIDLDAPITERVVRNVDRVLELLDECGVRGTFFVQGRVAETFPAMVRGIVEQGHEVQSHGHSHKALFEMDRDELREELRRAKATVEDAAGEPVTAFRAPDFSIVERNLWALEVLAEVGFEVDSSIFPMRRGRYGIAGWELGPHRIGLAGGASLLEVPVAIWSPGPLRLPVAGGGYLRLLPGPVVERGLRAILRSRRPPILYCHPYEFSPDELDDYRGQVPSRFRASQALGRTAFLRRLRALLTTLPFGRFDETLRAWELA